jgi:hypothetical protein
VDEFPSHSGYPDAGSSPNGTLTTSPNNSNNHKQPGDRPGERRTMTHEKYWTMKELGTLFGLSSHKIGRKLKDLGLRTQEGKPSQRAFAQGLVRQRWDEDRPVYVWAWHKDKTVALLKQAGMERIEDGQNA